MLPFSIELKRGRPTHEQILDAVREALASGQLRDGDPFPSARALTQELRVSPSSAQKVVTTLREEGFLAQQGGSGLIVRAARTHGGAAADADMVTLVDATPGSLSQLPLLASDRAGPQTIAGYQIVGLIARGGMGLVFEGFDPALERKVAIKVLAPQLATGEQARLRFLREARAAAAIDHEHVLPVHAVGEADGLPYLVMPLVNGESLGARLARDGALPLDALLRIGTAVARGLAAAHARGLVHRDIKPDNVLLEHPPGERVWLVDFGLARAAEGADLTQSGAIAGTPRFTSPEAAAGAAVDQRSDLFSLGATLYAMATGEPPFTGDNVLAVLRGIAEDSPAPPRARRPELPAGLDALTLALLEKDPQRRPADASSVANQLAQLTSQAG